VDLLNLSSPHGTAWQLLIAMLVVVVGPLLAERLRIPGLIGLLVGGWLIGSNALGIVPAEGGIVDELGEVGLLYLMFMAGLDLDLAVFRKYRKEAVLFSVLTFTAPMALGVIAGLALDYGTAASILLGSLFASYTLVVYPVVRALGLAPNRAVAATVGATVLTDTLALVVLAAVAGSATGSASALELVTQIGGGLLILAVWCFGVLPRVARWFFSSIGHERTLRYGFLLVALLSAGTLAEVVGIESIVGAFFAGLALNRLVPNGGEFMERIEFFGSALLIPMFLVSVGAVIDVRVMADPATLGLAAAFVAACIGGKAIAAIVCRPLFSFTWDEVGVVFGLSVAQAAATLAATFVGLNIGLFTISTVNAVMIVIVVSLLLASASASRFGARMPKPPVDASRLGRHVVVQFDDPHTAAALGGFSARLAASDGGVVQPVVIVPAGAERPTAAVVGELHHAISALGVDADVEVHHDRSVADGLVNLAVSSQASVVVVPAMTESWLPALSRFSHQLLVTSVDMPVVVVRPGDDAAPSRVVLGLNTPQSRAPTTAARFATEVAVRLGASGLPLDVIAADLEQASLELGTGFVGATVHEGQPTAWIAANARPGDLVVLPGGRNGALASARAAKAASARGASVVVVVDRSSLSTRSAGTTALI
jgi:Kef-type K+ transport system membrane component KefB